MLNEDLKEILNRLEDVFEKAHSDYIKSQDPIPSERELHFQILQDLYTDIKDQFDNQYSIKYVQKLEEEVEDLKFDLEDRDDIIENIRAKYDDLQEDFTEFKERVRELCS